ncbi:unnamed protein product [Absidia cylindrospora]
MIFGKSDEEGELSFTEGTRFVDVVDSTEEDWLEGRIEGTSQRGLFPSNYVNVITVSSTPTVVKPIRKTPNSDASLSQSVSPPSSNISSSWSVISNTPTTTTPTTTDINSSDTPTSKSARLNAFESAMQVPSSSKYSDIAATLMNKRPLPKPTMASTSSNTTPTNTSASIAATNDSNKSSSTTRAFVLPTLSPVQQQARARSFSASSTTSPTPPTSLKPSALRQDLRKTAQLDTSWRTKLDNGSSPTTITNTTQHLLLNTPTDSKVIITGTPGNDDEDMEEEDGYQLIKPSQLRKRQQQGKDFGKLNSPTTVPLSSSVSTSALPSQKSSSSSKTRLQTLPSSSTTHLAKLPSRPVSNANRLSKSRSSSTRTSNSSQFKNSDSTTSTDSSISNNNNNNNNSSSSASNKTAPTLKPKPPQLNKLPKTSMMITKERSASNPPPIQPKSFSNDIHRPSKPTVDSKPLFPLPTTQAEKNGTTAKTPPPLGARGGVALPGLGKKSSAPILPTRPSLATNQPISSSSGSTIDDIFKDKKHLDEDTNLKPSQLLTTQRARSSTNPSFATRPLIDITNGNGNRKLSSTALDTPTDGAIRSPPPPPPSTTSTTTKPSSSSPAIPLIIKQAPPPPPPSRQVNINSNKKESGAHTKYDGLFDTIQDDGYVDGLTTQVIWSKSRLPYDILAGIWQQCDQQKSGLLDRQRFTHGMQLIDTHLAKNRTSTTS